MKESKQIKLYSIKLYLAKTEKEKRITNLKNFYKSRMYKIRNGIADRIKVEYNIDDKSIWNEECKVEYKKQMTKNKRYKSDNYLYGKLDKILKDEINSFDGTRVIKTEELKKDKNIIAIFNNNLARSLDIKPGGDPTEDFMVIEAKNEDNILMQQVIKNGFTIGKDKYKFFTAGAGQIREKKFLMIKEDVWKNKEKKLMCGLTIKDINDNGGMNINKYLAYLALNNSSSEIWEGFDLDKSIVVDDMELSVNGEVDYITRDDKVFNGYIIDKNGNKRKKPAKTEWDIQRQKMDVPIPVMDGCGICLPSVSKKNIQIRLPWIKGLISPTSFDEFAKEHNSTKVTDIYGREWDVVEDKIEVIFTKSQFKMWKFYNSWAEYKSAFTDNKCIASICKEDVTDFKNMHINYQMLQTLNEMTDEQIENLTKETKEIINAVHHSKDAQLKFFKATKDNKKISYFQECLRLYPEMLTSAYVKKNLSDTINKFKNDIRSGKINLNMKRTFLIPDLVAFMEWLFLGEDQVKGALVDGEVYCKLYKNDGRLGVLRSPHLSREWAIRKNVVKDKPNKYFITKGIYTSARDLISKVLMFDNDGDEALVVSDKEEWLLDLAEKQMKDIRPLYYEMGKAGAKKINMDSIYDSLKFAFEKANIGKVSNTLTKIWNSEDPNKYNDEIKFLTTYNNFVIDAAKTLQIPKTPNKLKEIMKKDKGIYPYFFQYAKGKKKWKCKEMGNAVMDRICKSIDDIKYTEFDYSKGFGKFRTSKLCNNSKIKIDEKVIMYFNELESYADELRKDYNNTGKKEQCSNIYVKVERQMKDFCIKNNLEYKDAVDMIVKYCFKDKDRKLGLVFNVFGDVIVKNLEKNFKKNSIDEGYILCKDCGKRVKKTNNRMMRCGDCAEEENKRKTLVRQKTA